jgi:hypothetical protein
MQISALKPTDSPLARPRRVQGWTAQPVARRAIAGVVTLLCVAVLTVAVLLAPSERGLGTHEQLNLPPCGWVLVADMPCMTCGMTTAFSHAVRGQFLASLLAQPMGFLLAMATGMTMFIGLHVTVTGSNLPIFLGRLWSGRMLWVLGAVFLGAWLFKILSYKEFIG